MLMRSIVGAVAAAALVAGPIGAAPAQAQVLDVPCEILGVDDPYDYPCETAEDALLFVEGEAVDAVEFVFAVRDEAGRLVFVVYCTVFPNQPQCL